ncbi:nuclear transport factor 2-like protein [Kineococcus arenarius]|uniref:nuclear transport factor 2 family protein n=1 Tax=unclassified Kineococcus TaxID=2621656 RepID=UPI003D7CC685
MSTPDTDPTSVRIDHLPATVRAFLAAHDAREAGAALRTFAPGAVVVDDGRTHRGPEQVLEFLRDAGTRFTYTSELVGAQRVDDAHWVTSHHLVGDFPGGTADLRYRFALEDDLITELVIAP